MTFGLDFLVWTAVGAYVVARWCLHRWQLQKRGRR
jgi:hypothetical protein